MTQLWTFRGEVHRFHTSSLFTCVEKPSEAENISETESMK